TTGHDGADDDDRKGQQHEHGDRTLKQSRCPDRARRRIHGESSEVVTHSESPASSSATAVMSGSSTTETLTRSASGSRPSANVIEARPVHVPSAVDVSPQSTRVTAAVSAADDSNSVAWSCSSSSTRAPSTNSSQGLPPKNAVAQFDATTCGVG